MSHHLNRAIHFQQSELAAIQRNEQKDGTTASEHIRRMGNPERTCG